MLPSFWYTLGDALNIHEPPWPETRHTDDLDHVRNWRSSNGASRRAATKSSTSPSHPGCSQSRASASPASHARRRGSACAVGPVSGGRSARPNHLPPSWLTAARVGAPGEGGFGGGGFVL